MTGANASQLFNVGSRLFVANGEGALRAHEVSKKIDPAVAFPGSKLSMAAFLLPMGDRLLDVDRYGYSYAHPFGASVGRGELLAGPRIGGGGALPPVVLGIDGRIVTVNANGELWASDVGNNVGAPYRVATAAIPDASPSWYRSTDAVAMGNRIVVKRTTTWDTEHWYGFDINPPHCDNDRGHTAAGTPARGGYCAPRSADEPGWHQCRLNATWEYAPDDNDDRDCNPHVNTLRSGEYLKTGDYLQSNNGKFFLIQQSDGNFVEYAGWGPGDEHGWMWATQAYPGQDSYFTSMQTDGRLVVSRGTGPAANRGAIWSSVPAGAAGSYRLVLQDDGNVVVLKDITGQPSAVVWTAGLTHDVGSVLRMSEYLKVGQYLRSQNGKYFVVQQDDGNLVVYIGTGPNDKRGVGGRTQRLAMGVYFTLAQPDGTSSPITAPIPPWGPTRSGIGDVQQPGRRVLWLENDGNLVLPQRDVPVQRRRGDLRCRARAPSRNFFGARPGGTAIGPTRCAAAFPSWRVPAIPMPRRESALPGSARTAGVGEGYGRQERILQRDPRRARCFAATEIRSVTARSKKKTRPRYRAWEPEILGAAANPATDPTA